MTAKATHAEFEAQVAPLMAELRAYCYRMLGSLQDAEDALQEALLGAWRGLAGFEGRSTLRSWLYRIATHACVRVISRRPRRMLALEYAPASDTTEVGAFVSEPIWLEPYPDDPAANYEQRESVELAFVAALQHLPATQRAVLILREVLGFDAASVAAMLETTVPATNSALQRARKALEQSRSVRSQQATLSDLGEDAQRALVASYVDAWARADVAALVALLADDVRFSMPPIPAWFAGRDMVARFFGERVFATPWRLVPTRASGQLAFACYQGPAFRLGALNVIALRDHSIIEMTGFLDPAVHARFSLPAR
jgi:RNA polymerase sigma-70 factor (TIGR02960 family)